MAQYDGAVRIDTRVETGNFNTAMTKISRSMGSFLKSLATTFAVGIMAVLTVLIAVLGFLSKGIRTAFEEFKKIQSATKDVTIFKNSVSELEASFATLKGAMGAALLPFFLWLMPYLQMAINRLIVFFNLLAMIMAAIFRQKTVMLAVVGQTTQLGSSSGKYADNMERAEEAAKGSLASFDKLEVLQIKKDEEKKPSTAGGGAGGGLGAVFEEVEVPEGFLSKMWDAIKTGAKKKWDELKTGAIEAWEKIKIWAIETWDEIKEWWKASYFYNEVWIPIRDGAIQTWAEIKEWVINAWEKIKEKWQGAKIWFNESILLPIKNLFIEKWDEIRTRVINTWNEIKSKWQEAKDWFNSTLLEPIKQLFKSAFGFISILVYDAWVTIKFIWGEVALWFDEKVLQPVKKHFIEKWEIIREKVSEAWSRIKDKWAEAKDWFSRTVILPIQNLFIEKWDAIKARVIGTWESIKTAWQEAKDWFQNNIINPIKNAFDMAWNAIAGTVTRVFNGIVTTIRGALNGVIRIINELLNLAMIGVNGIIRGLNSFGSRVPGWYPIPQLSTPQIPYLAKGAVIPPNAPFAAILGDQKSGTNIEAPENLLRKIFNEEINKVSQELVLQMPVYLDSHKIYEGQTRVSKRLGKSFVIEGV